MEVSGQLHTLAALPPGERAPCSRWVNCVDPRAHLDNTEEKNFVLLGTKPRLPSPKPITIQTELSDLQIKQKLSENYVQNIIHFTNILSCQTFVAYF
jgi:hypothetical protein